MNTNNRIQLLTQAYLNTTYRVYINNINYIDLKIAKYNENLAHWLQSKSLNQFCVITAFNPYSQLLSKQENLARNARLQSELKQLPCQIYKADGIPIDNTWSIENSLFITELDKDIFIQLAIKYEQNAIVSGDKNAIPELIFV